MLRSKPLLLFLISEAAILCNYPGHLVIGHVESRSVQRAEIVISNLQNCALWIAYLHIALQVIQGSFI